jgi:hypothetical protein
MKSTNIEQSAPKRWARARKKAEGGCRRSKFVKREEAWKYTTPPEAAITNQ